MSAQFDRHSRFNVARLWALSDGVFAVGLTLLILDVRPPDGSIDHLADALRALAPRLGIFALSFAIVAYYWVVHHLIFTNLRAANRGVLWLNLLFLFTIVVLPFSTAVLARYPLSALAITVYGINLAACSIVLGFAWTYAVRCGLIAAAHPLQRRSIARRFALSSALTLAGIAVAHVAPFVSLALYLALPVAYAMTSGDRSARLPEE